MQAPSQPDNETQRLAALRALQLLDTPAEARFDRLTHVAQQLFDVPIALISLVDQSRQWFKSCVGLSVAETPRDISFCGHAILSDELLVIEDTLVDPRFADNPLVAGDPKIRFYAGCPVRAGGGEALGTLCIIDRTPRRFGAVQRRLLRDLGRWAEQELNLLDLRTATYRVRASEERLQAIVDNVADGIITFDTSGQLESLNGAAARLFGYGRDELLGTSFTILLAPEDAGRYQAYLRDYLASARLRPLGGVIEARGRHQQGHTFPIEFSATDLHLGTRHLFIAVVRDITERKKLDRLKNEFISTVSHELRTPLTSIRGAIGLITGGAVGEIPAAAKELLDIACANSERLVRLINDILDVEKIESGAIELRSENLPMMVAVRQAIAAVQGYARELGVEIKLQAGDRDPCVVADADRLQQVLVNLLSNAVKFSPRGATAQISIVSGDARVRVEIADQGPGISAEFATRIFQKFAQADTSDSRAKGGTGLGLSICKAIVEQLGGAIGYSTVVGVGSVFHFELPAQRDR